MTNPAGYSPFYSDPRGNRLERWTLTRAQGGALLWLRGPSEVARQVQAAAPEYQSCSLGPDAIAKGWTHLLFVPQAVPRPPSVRPEIRQLLTLLTEIVSVPISPTVDFALALDWYKKPEGEDPYAWPNTEVGDLVSAGKYRYRYQAEPQAVAGRALTDRLCDAIGRHVVLRGASIVLDVPGHDGQRVSFGSRLAAAVARSWDLPMSRVGTKSAFRPESKNLGGAQQSLLQDEFVVDEVVRGQSVLIVDDVIRSGVSMAAVGKAARAAGARQILGICATRTMRR
jgi:Phosphoribosyl transferase domain